MTAERWQQVKALLYSALERDESGRRAFLEGACGSDATLRREVEALLEYHQRAGDVFEMPAATIAFLALTAEQEDSLAGTTAGPYQLLSPLGAGGMGVVYLAHDARLGRKVALKLLPAHFTRDPDRLRRFQQEAIAASRLNHPNIVTIFEVGQADALHYIATEYIDGLTLREVMAEKPLDLGESLDAAVQVASALAAAHAAGIVHRDIKPENLMLRRDGYLKVLDFGLAKLTERPAAQPGESDTATVVKTDPGTVIGTVKYMSPEQARGLEVDARTDIWSLGVVLYEMVSGRLPFAGSTTADVLVSILEREAAPLTGRLEAVPAELDAVVRKALTKDPGRRYSRVEDLGQDLRRIQHDLAFTATQRRRTQDGSGADVPGDRDLPAGRTGESPEHNLSTQLRTIIGREAEIAAVEALLCDAGVRLLTLTGPGGTGKTRLGQQAARGLLPRFDDGVFFVALAPITDHHQVASTIARAVGVQETSARTFAAGLKDYLSDKTTLLVLDNFEHVAAAATEVAELLATCPGLKVLVTSRSALRVSGEREFRVPPLALPEAGSIHSAKDLMQFPAAVMFVQRVLTAKPQFTVTDANAATIAEICIQLDGLPLALELAAARTKLLSLEEMRARMDHRLTLLKGGQRDLPARQQTMRAAIAWSYDLLGEAEKTLLHRQSVFLGGFTLSAAESVCGQVKGAEGGVLDALETLVDESLVRKMDMADGSYRFVMLETIREFALEHLQARGEEEAVRQRHANFFVHMAEEAEPHLMSAAREPWLRRLDGEHNNLQAALRWAAENDAVETGLRLAGALRWFWYHRGHFGEGWQWASRFLGMATVTPNTRARAKALYCAGSLAFYYGGPAAARPLLDESVAAWRALGDPQFLARTLTFSSLATSLGRDEFARARAQAEESVALFRALDDQWGLALSLTYAGVIMWMDPEAEARASALFTESVALFRNLGDEWGAAGSILYLGAIKQYQGDNAAARPLYEEFVSAMRVANDPWRLASGLDILAELLRAEGEPQQAATLIEESQALQRKLGKSLNLRQVWDQMKRLNRHEEGR